MILKNLDGEAWTGLIWLRIGKGGGLLRMLQRTSGSIDSGEFLDYLRDF